MLDSAPALTVVVTPYTPPNPACIDTHAAFIESGSPITGFGDCPLGALTNLADVLIDQEKPAEMVAALTQRVALEGAEALCHLIDWFCAWEDADRYIPLAIDLLEPLDKVAGNIVAERGPRTADIEAVVVCAENCTTTICHFLRGQKERFDFGI
ncbi:hypothetical protein [Leisingera sp. F5]|uniref:hypothetical protein n=1 Tax=Leisingera sp. F5 TaxID=1813816 RepID=UPI000ACC85E2|nr:hypothetical protein [Leisingera sp. F5]